MLTPPGRRALDPGVITPLVTAIFAGIAAIITAVALLKRATAPNSKERRALEAIWMWLEAHDLVGQVPDRTKRQVLKIIDTDEDAAADEEAEKK